MFRPNVGMPGMGTLRKVTPRIVTANGKYDYLPGGKIIDGFKTRDCDNPDYPADASANRDVRPGVLFGMVAATGKFANSFFGQTQAAIAAAATSLQVTLNQAAEIVRRVGPSGTFRLIGPPAAAGTVAVQTVTYSNVNLGTGVVTITAVGAAAVAGSLIGQGDGTELPLSFMTEEWGQYIPDDGSDTMWPLVPVETAIIDSQIIAASGWPADVALRQWIRDQLRRAGQFTWTQLFNP